MPELPGDDSLISALPAELAFLPAFGFAADELNALADASYAARISPVHRLIMSGALSADVYYRGLAAHLGCDFYDEVPDLRWIGDLGEACRSGCALIAKADARLWLLAPEGEVLSRIAAAPDRLPDFAITTPDRFAAALQRSALAERRRLATQALDPVLCARGSEWSIAAACLAAALAIVTALSVVGPITAAGAMALVFIAATAPRVVAALSGWTWRQTRAADPGDDALPVYTILVPLHDEAAVVADLLWSLARLDYPSTKLEIRLILEPEDLETRRMLAGQRLPPWFQIVITPDGRDLRTKPRALNIGLIGARGEYVTVYDAEDRPQPNQLRAAAARFAADPDLAALQAPLRIEGGGLLARLHRAEYAGLFEIVLPGHARRGWPIPLGGSSNHLRRAALEKAGGWDAWNVTEDADLGLRLARCGMKVGTLEDSGTWETAPPDFAAWFRQRQRWMKGWMQTFAVLARDPRRVARQAGVVRTAVLAALFANILVGPLLRPVYVALLLGRLARGRLNNWVVETVLLSVPAVGLACSVVLCAGGLARIGHRRSWPLLAVLPLYEVAIGFAGWFAIVDLLRRPQHWHKTPHRPRPQDNLSPPSPAGPPRRQTEPRRDRPG